MANGAARKKLIQIKREKMYSSKKLKRRHKITGPQQYRRHTFSHIFGESDDAFRCRALAKQTTESTTHQSYTYVSNGSKKEKKYIKGI